MPRPTVPRRAVPRQDASSQRRYRSCSRSPGDEASYSSAERGSSFTRGPPPPMRSGGQAQRPPPAACPDAFKDAFNIAFSLAKYSLVDLKIVDIKGRQIRQLLNNDFAAGRHGVSWNGTNDLGGTVGSGIYFMVLRAEGKVLSQKLSLIR